MKAETLGKSLRRALPALWLAGAGTAWAADFYVGGSGQTPLEDRAKSYAFPNEGVDADLGFDVRAGVQLGRFVGAEAAWHHLGEVRWCPQCADAGGSAGTKAWSAGVTLGQDFGRVRPFAKLGWFRAVTEGSSETIAGPRPLKRTEDGALFEAGLRLSVTSHLALRVGYEHFAFDSGDGALSFGADYRF